MVSLMALLVICFTPTACSVYVYTVSGHVYEDGYPTSGTPVTVTYHGMAYTGTTDSSGFYTVHCDPGTGAATVTATFKGNSAVYVVASPNLVKLNDIVDLNIASAPGPKEYLIQGTVSVDGAPTNGAFVYTSVDGTTYTNVTHGTLYTAGAYQLFTAYPMLPPAPITVTALYNGQSQSKTIGSPNTVKWQDTLNFEFTTATATATATAVPTATPTVTPVPMATAITTPTVTVTGTPVPTSTTTLPAASPSATTTPLSPSTPADTLVPPVATGALSPTPTARPPLFQTGYSEELFLALGALGAGAVLMGIRKK